jgi:hypothetical protein
MDHVAIAVEDLEDSLVRWIHPQSFGGVLIELKQ